jgi:endonuclease-3
MTENRARRILTTLRLSFTLPTWIMSKRDPFETLILTIISQNTSDRNSARAFENLLSRFTIKPKVLAEARPDQIEECLKVAGLYRNKAKTIKQVSRTVLDQFHGHLEQVLCLPLAEARTILLELPGVGPKTADVVLLFSGRKPTIPVDTHVYRVSKRLGLAPERGNYEAVRTSLQEAFCPDYYAVVHLLLISHGRKYCKAGIPRCKKCPVNELCPSRCKWDNCDRA